MLAGAGRGTLGAGRWGCCDVAVRLFQSAEPSQQEKWVLFAVITSSADGLVRKQRVARVRPTQMDRHG